MKTKDEYQIINETAYHKDTPERVVGALENCRLSRQGYRLRLYFGDTVTGKDWGEIHDVTGYVGRSTGNIKVPLLLYNKRSYGGPHILDHCIVRIQYARTSSYGDRDLYRHEKYHKE